MAGKVGDSSKLFRHAIRMFAQEHSLDFTKVTQEKVENPEGVEHYACVGLDLGSRGSTGQAIARAFRGHLQAKSGATNGSLKT